ncbi:magnesium-translocating P-type ATPase [Chitinophaga oryziterrae]|uniref:Magnesium-transporting ATPase, P-type 1 n=1 Tax=Chitinophaga oryziterrae TaxID=1031224 RepID=A0A6N8JE47_9BACT|nr:magnesium-translocating P-type ATPase [Chitinophaga oryziterrae]MVT42392.1 magnesium-translocating P-type ATPase [Chitinophaga oryziterrae]
MENQTEQVNQFWHLTKEEVLHLLAADENGLNDQQVAQRLKTYGINTIRKTDQKSSLILFLSQFKSPITILLIVAALLSLGLGDVTNTIIILIILFISSLLSFWQESGAANAAKELLKMVHLHCTILRNGQKGELPIENVVPGDIISLTAGDVIPADSLLINSQELFVDEAAFTGETYPVEKNCGVLPVDTPLSKRSNVLLMGAHIISGKATAIVVKTGRLTEFGKISAGLLERSPETDFERGIRKFGYLLMELTLLLVITIFAINVFLHRPVLDSFLFSLALAVGLTPQLLPTIISVNLSAGAKRMAIKKVIVKRLSSIENLGSMDILCSDKSGTVTEGHVNLKDTLDSSGTHSEKVLKYAWLNASLQQGFHNPIDEAICSGYQGAIGNYTILAEIPYDFIRKRLTIQVRHEQENLAITKGALTVMLSVCSQVEMQDGSLTSVEESKAAILKQYEQFSKSGFRTLGLAYKRLDTGHIITKAEEKDMIFLGFVTLFDPLKANVSAIIGQLNKLGVKLKLITGDNALVANSLALEIGITEPKILTGAQLQKMSNAALLHQAPLVDIFAEVEPNQKERIILILKKAGHVIGFMGDGINDASALHAADVGISVDTAVDVAREAADIVLLSKGLEVLTEGIIEGRKTFANTMKYIFMATSANFGNMFSMAGASLFLNFLPLLPKQILLTNLLTDFPEMTIALDKVDDINTKYPQRWDLPFIKHFMIIFGLLSSIFDYITFGILLFVLHANEKAFQTGWFIESVISASLIVLVVRTRLPFFKSLPGKYLAIATTTIVLFVLILPITPMAFWLGFTPLPIVYYGWILLVISGYIVAAELTKKWFYRKIIT